MKVNYECASCMLRQSREAIEHATEDTDERMDATLKVLNFMNTNFRKDYQSNKLGTRLHHMIMDTTGNHDPYREFRDGGNELASGMIPMVEELIHNDDSLENFVKIAVAGNVIDFGALDQDTDMESLIKKQIRREPVINDIEKLDNALRHADTVLFLTDNGGEIVFDKLLLQKIKEDYDVEIILALKEDPIINDAIVSDAYDLGLDEYATIISTGAASVGVVEEYISDELKDLLNIVDLVVSKGMGNYEGLTEMRIDAPVYFLFTTKCNVISREIGVPIGSPIILEKFLN